MLYIIFVLIPVFLITYILLVLTRSSSSTDKDKDKVKKVKSQVSQNQNPGYIVNNRLKICSAEELINIFELNPVIQNIKENMGLSHENWIKDGLPFLYKYIEFVQRLPASEYHHHAGDGGLVKHSLDVAILSLMISTEKIWPPNAKTEDIPRLIYAWRYGIMIAAILHDIGKIITNFKIRLFATSHPNSQSILWVADAGSMLETGNMYYTVDFINKDNNASNLYNKSKYLAHTELGYIFFQAMVPLHVRQWLATTDSNLISTLRNYLSGIKSNHALEEVITKADMTSTARDLKSGSRQRFLSATRLPLNEIIMETLIYMLSQRGGYFSIAVQSGGDIFRIGDKVYIVSRYVADYVRNFLNKNQPEYAKLFPQDNHRIFDTLSEYALVGHTEYDKHDKHKIVFTAKITLANNPEVTHTLTVIQFRLSSLYPKGDYPEEFQGEFKLLNKTEVEEAEAEEKAKAEAEEKAKAEAEEKAKAEAEEKAKAEAEEKAKAEAEEKAQAEAEEKEAEDTQTSAVPVQKPISKTLINQQVKLLNKLYKEHPPTTSFPRPVLSIPSPSPETPATEDGQKDDSITDTDPQKALLFEHGNKFLQWLTNRLANGNVSYNKNDSMIHFVEQGMLLITPKIFKYYADGKFDKTNSNCPGLLAQKGFVSLNLHTRSKKSSIFTALGVKNNNHKLFSCYLISQQNLCLIINHSNKPANNIEIILKEFIQDIE